MSQPDMPRTTADVTPQWLTAALRGRWPEIEVRRADADVIGAGIGQMSVLQRLTLDHRGAPDAPRQMVLKLHTPHPDMGAVAARYHMYEREVNFYQRLADRVPITTPDVYFAQLDGPDCCVLLMQDLSAWHSPDQISGPTQAETELAVTQLARLTATFWDAPELDAESSWLPDWSDDYMRAGVDDYRACVPEFLRRFESRLPDGSAGAARAIAERLDKLVDVLNTGVRVLTHYDYRVENMFFSNDQPPDFCAVDWQLILRSRPGWDLAYLLGTNLPAEVRRRHANQLKDRYLTALHSEGVSGYSRADLDLDFALNTMAMTTIPVIGGANADLSNPRNVELFAAISGRAFGAVLEDRCLATLP